MHSVSVVHVFRPLSLYSNSVSFILAFILISIQNQFTMVSASTSSTVDTYLCVEKKEKKRQKKNDKYLGKKNMDQISIGIQMQRGKNW